ncbi:hypothetical protein VPNG_03623 [Cytospora leucostoma]|uniref:Rhodopsin domain-containing protein n=1 Tax=Cytospora leucostoma TaxID=1230097 RepID=A0A423XCN9_9PEZI|nr:hypothetical protein VPNG_03623 [Cytospora leucostoma]
MSFERRATASPVVTGPGIPYHKFMGVQWAGAGFSVAFVFVRLISRCRGPRRIFWDDVCAVVAAVLVLITACLWQWAARDMYYILDLQAGLVPYDAALPSRLSRELKISFVTEVFFYATLFLVKISLILFFKRLGSNVSGQAYIRWSALALSAICFGASIGAMGLKAQCMLNSDVEYLETYCASRGFYTITTKTITASCVLDVASDLAITIIPFTLLWGVRTHLPKRLAFIGLFSLTLLTVAAAIARVIETNVTKKEDGAQDPTYVSMWGTIQAAVAVIVSCLSAFPQLFAASARKKKPQWSPSETWNQRLRSRMQKQHARSTDPLHNISAVTIHERDHKSVMQATYYDSQRPMLRPEAGRTAAQCSAATNSSPTPQHQIMRQVEYTSEVADNPAAEPQQPMQSQRVLGFRSQVPL